MTTPPKSLLNRDRRAIWHPFTPLDGEEPILPIVRGKDSWLYTETDEGFLDSQASWWVNLHGHAHPDIKNAISSQFEQLDHTLFGGITHPQAVRFGERLLDLLPGDLSKVFYSDNGSTAVEVALKMCVQHFHLLQKRKTRFLALEGAYHGDTFGTMSVGERGAFTAPFQNFLYQVNTLPLPTADSIDSTLATLRELSCDGEVAGFIYEPLIQGASGMRMYEPQHLNHILLACQELGIPTIADEVMTGFGRTGPLFASELLYIKPDIICLSKGITGGVLPLGATAVSKRLTEPFEQGDRSRMFFHGHSYTANALACASANASLDILLSEECEVRRAAISEQQKTFAASLQGSDKLLMARSRGVVFACNFTSEEQPGYLNTIRPRLYGHFLDRGILLRPLGNVIYTIPPYCMTDTELKSIHLAIEATVNL